MFAGVEVGDVYVDEACLGILERRLGGRCEVGPAGAYADDEVGLAGRAVGCEGARRADGAKGARVVVWKGALACLCLADGDARAFTQAPQGLCRLRVDDAPPATIMGRREARIMAAARSMAPASGKGALRARSAFRRTLRDSRRPLSAHPAGALGNGPVSAWFVSTRMAARAAGITCSGRTTLSQYRDTGLKQSLTERVPSWAVSSCCRTGRVRARRRHRLEGAARAGGLSWRGRPL